MQITHHKTGAGDIVFAALKVPFLNSKTKNREFSIKLELDMSDPQNLVAAKHIEGINDKKLTTSYKTKDANGKVSVKKAKEGNYFVNFVAKEDSDIKVFDSEGNLLEKSNIPFFDSRTDSGKAVAIYSVITYDNGTEGQTQIIRLTAVKLINLNITEKENSNSSKGLSVEDIQALL